MVLEWQSEAPHPDDVALPASLLSLLHPDSATIINAEITIANADDFIFIFLSVKNKLYFKNKLSLHQYKSAIFIKKFG